jgi:predicted dehydrogenase
MSTPGAPVSGWLEQPILVVGSGSIGRRHIRNLRALGFDHIAAVDVNPDLLQSVAEELGVIPFADFDAALSEGAPGIVFVCTPPVFHVPQARAAVKAGAHVFVEKPLSHTLDGVDELIREAARAELVVQVGYNFRFHPGIRKLKAALEEGTIGRVLWARAEAGQYLPDWRPWQDYRRGYTARKALGGGIILDGSHEIDYILWLLGKPHTLVCMANKVSDLEVDVEDCATILLRFEEGAQADVHVDFLQRAYARTCKIVGEEGTLLWDYSARTIRHFDARTGQWYVEEYEFDGNDMYMAELEHFLRTIQGEAAAVNDLSSAAETLRVVLSAKRSAESQRIGRGDD